MLKKNKTLYLFRHGETFATRDTVPYGEQVLSAPILPEGKPIIEKLGKHLADKNIEYFVSSEMLRCRQTSEIVSGHVKLNFETNAKINEFYNETFEAFKARVSNFVAEIEAREENVIAVCTHGGCLSALKHLIINDKYSEYQLLDYPRPGVLMKIENGSLAETDFN